jgi:hypothetical protein
MDDHFFELIDFIIVSIYPVTRAKMDAIDSLLRRKSGQFDFTFEIVKTNLFHNLETPYLSDREAQQSFERCRRRLV